MVAVTGRFEQATAAKEMPQGEVCPVFLGIPDDDVAALFRRLFLPPWGRTTFCTSPQINRAWASQGRAAQHSSHAANPRPHH
jgi:hypothetical protein